MWVDDAWRLKLGPDLCKRPDCSKRGYWCRRNSELGDTTRFIYLFLPFDLSVFMLCIWIILRLHILRIVR